MDHTKIARAAKVLRKINQILGTDLERHITTIHPHAPITPVSARVVLASRGLVLGESEDRYWIDRWAIAYPRDGAWLVQLPERRDAREIRTVGDLCNLLDELSAATLRASA